MRVSNFLSAAFAATALVVPLEAADEDCTWAIHISVNGNWNSASKSCHAMVYKGHIDPPTQAGDVESVQGELTCASSGGCDGLEYNGQNYVFCHDGMASGTSETQIKSAASVHRDGGTHTGIFPDGWDNEHKSASPVHAYTSHFYWQHGTCP